MFLSMAAMALTTYALLALHTPLPTFSTPLAIEECSEEARSEVWNSLPECRPRPTLITLPLPRDPSILQVILVTLSSSPVPGDSQPGGGGAMCRHLPPSRRSSVPAVCGRAHQKYKVSTRF